MQPDTRKFLKYGSVLFAVGVLSTLLMFLAFGGVTHQGPHTNMGWITLMITMSCVPLGAASLLFGLAKLYGDRHR